MCRGSSPTGTIWKAGAIWKEVRGRSSGLAVFLRLEAASFRLASLATAFFLFFLSLLSAGECSKEVQSSSEDSLLRRGVIRIIIAVPMSLMIVVERT
jgi:hypothetical protein